MQNCQMTQSPKRTSLWANGLIWFGAALSIAEIQTGTFLAPLGFGQGMLAIFMGHLIGCALLFGAGVIGGKVRKSSMEAAKMTFGSRGALLFAGLNILQLLGWTGIMIYEGALAAGGLLGAGHELWCLLIGLLIILWLAIGLENLSRLNALAMAALLLLTLLLSSNLASASGAAPLPAEAMSFGLALELSIAMPLSWLPLISDYTRKAQKPVRAAAVSTIVYGLVSSWMYLMGLGAALAFGEADIAQIMLKSGLGLAGLAIILFSTVTTTYLDAYSAGVSGEALSSKAKGKALAIAVTLLGTGGAIFLPLLDFTDFLYFIGSVFAPMIAVQLVNHLMASRNYETSLFCWSNLLVWLAGFLLYRFLMETDLPIGSTLPDMLLTMCLSAAAIVLGNRQKEKEEPATL
ncbi:putative hydroxymethylpyrimidine transporter CytX [Selenomonas sp. KH1T6]|uniref:putative hydroxymethylpyrimidine transporter CytX n=1 Tax=Selenomonas sp. KH1T6 TaxID=3158784 RepID=UPI0008A79A16|nr:putative hydroxymethylpyrimidine transporter CytX [Selenomonas ruminantium]